MNKAQLIEKMAKESRMPKSACKNCLESFIRTVRKALKQGDSVSLTGFGTFGVIKRKERIGVNPSTGQKMKIAAKRVPKFKPGRALRETVM
ncbi:MAG: HU family DNA-binding protein [Candidatus Babeliaceae bacterium]|nr:HU family DNA-binding protein [Candidatus Babeliaceae bacterium]